MVHANFQIKSYDGFGFRFLLEMQHCHLYD